MHSARCLMVKGVDHSNAIKAPAKMESPADYPAIFETSQAEDHRRAADDLAPARGVLIGLFVGGAMWLLLIYVLATVL